MKYKVVIADVDGTLIAPSENEADRPSERVIEAVKRVTKKGLIFSVASGRSLFWVRNIIQAFDLKSPIILDNGARIYDCGRKKYLWESLLNKNIAYDVLSFLHADKNLRVFINFGDKRITPKSETFPDKIAKILVLGVTPKKAEELHQTLRKFSNIHVTKTVSGTGGKSESIHVTDINATKQVAAFKLMELLGVAKEEVIGIGDSYNDFPLLMACGLKVAMGNAVSEIKEIADYIAPSYQEDGVAEVIERFILK